MLSGIRSTLKSLLPSLLWPALAAVAIVAVVGVMRHTGAAQLRDDARSAALTWATFLTRTVPDLDLILDGEPASAPAQDHLLASLAAEAVFRFRLYAPDGRLVLESDSLGTPPSEPQAARPHERALLVARSGIPWVEVIEDGQRPLPPVYGHAYVPIDQGAQRVGAVEVLIDQSARAERIRAASLTVAAAVLVVLLGLVGVAALQWSRSARNRRAAEHQMQYLAHHDLLTGKLNRASFQAEVARAAARRGAGGPGFAVLCIDLDGFKEVNDSVGQAAGDELLRQVAARLQDSVRSADLVARLGGDEFAVLQTGVQASDDVATLAQRIVRALARPHDLARQVVPSSASVGAAIHGMDGTDAAELMHRADVALYRAKSQGGGNYSFYDAGLDEQLQSRRALTRDLREALAQDGLMLYYQPLFGADGVQLCGYEALARWRHPVRGMVPPTEFIAVAEATGLIDELGRWVLRKACAEAARWPEPLSVAVNLSAAQFRHEGALIKDVAEALADAGLPPQRLELEITESLLIGNADQTLAALMALHEMGVRIAMDDFGTGYSSLSYLWRFPFDKVKIDRAFTQNMHNDAKVSFIIRSIISLAHSMDMRVNAEGVETPSQLAALREHGCDELQGFLLGRPAPAASLAHLPQPPRETAALPAPQLSEASPG